MSKYSKYKSLPMTFHFTKANFNIVLIYKQYFLIRESSEVAPAVKTWFSLIIASSAADTSSKVLHACVVPTETYESVNDLRRNLDIITKLTRFISPKYSYRLLHTKYITGTKIRIFWVLIWIRNFAYNVFEEQSEFRVL